jgi:ATP adenylyltransferase
VEQLWAPWRLAYVAQPEKPKPDGPDCFLCRGLAASDDRGNLIALRNRLSCVVLNRFPYNNGHLLIAPLAHKGELGELTGEESAELQGTIVRMVAVLRKRMSPDGFNVGLNLGRAAGAGLPGHLHWHVVPRWAGDTNFMPVVSDVRVIVQSLDALYDLLREELESKGAGDVRRPG